MILTLCYALDIYQLYNICDSLDLAHLEHAVSILNYRFQKKHTLSKQYCPHSKLISYLCVLG